MKFLKTNYAGDDKKVQSAVFMKEFQKVKKIVSKEQSFKQEQELIDSMMTKVLEKESREENAALLCFKSNFENQVEGSQNEVSHKEVKTTEERLNSSTKTDVSECASVASKNNDSSYGANNNMECRKVLTNFGKNSRNSSLDKVISNTENAELISLYGLLIFCFLQKLF